MNFAATFVTCKQLFNFFSSPLFLAQAVLQSKVCLPLESESLTAINKYSSDGIEITSQKLQLDLNSLTAAPHLSWCPAVFNWPSESTSSLHLDYFE